MASMTRDELLAIIDELHFKIRNLHILNDAECETDILLLESIDNDLRKLSTQFCHLGTFSKYVVALRDRYDSAIQAEADRHEEEQDQNVQAKV